MSSFIISRIIQINLPLLQSGPSTIINLLYQSLINSTYTWDFLAPPFPSPMFPPLFLFSFSFHLINMQFTIHAHIFDNLHNGINFHFITPSSTTLHTFHPKNCKMQNKTLFNHAAILNTEYHYTLLHCSLLFEEFSIKVITLNQQYNYKYITKYNLVFLVLFYSIIDFLLFKNS